MIIEWPDEWFEEEELTNTPLRIQRFIQELRKKQDFEFTLFDAKGYDEMIVLKDIPFFSLCSHHLFPFTGKAHIGYIPSPKGKICGISKLPRALEKFASRPQLQERLTNEVADFLSQKLEPLGVGVILVAEHLCMKCRGVEMDGVKTVTSAMLGNFRKEPETRNEFLMLVKL
jgi:GTP cyclohydrolase I